MTRRNPARRHTVKGAIAGIRTAQTRTASARVRYHYTPDVRELLEQALALLARAEAKARAARRLVELGGRVRRGERRAA